MSTHRLEGRKREERLGELRNVARHKRALTNWRGGRGRSGLVSLETWHVTNEHSLAGGEEEGGARSGDHTPELQQPSNLVFRLLLAEKRDGEIRNVARRKTAR